ncbi:MULTISPECIES: hypothetical protein [Actinomadura]|uniref:Uncharacterized protein n=1 Tax=Actinomadura litoris TaxID=2678616 RepID=A0A7K1KSJ6_9ACTN|nr:MULTISPECIES: hypothetical protein [Actinomadura]MBT2208173.1 hypothetical protein [Actinomadura sp. NEAU-AAG7]MUN34997.1 hypothetical protein [Actinomadura litoris]
MPGGFPPPPRRSGGGAAVPLLIVGGMVLLALIGVGAFVVLNSGDDKDDPPAITFPSARPTYTPPSTGSIEPSPTTSLGGGGSDPTSLLSATVRTAKGNTFTRAGTRTESCITRANTKLLSRLRTDPCIGSMYSAVYANPSRTIITSVSIAKFATPSAASRIGNATDAQGWPKLLTPSDASGLPQPRANPAYWTRTWTRGSSVIYAQSYWTHGGATGGRTGSVFATAGELGVEITNALLFTN